MFKLLLVGRKCGLSDEKLEVLAEDSLRLMRFLGVALGDPIPDRATIVRYRTQLDENTMRELIDAFKTQNWQGLLKERSLPCIDHRC